MLNKDINIAFHDYFRMIVKRKKFFIIPLIAACLVGGFLLFNLPEVYEASTVILIQEEKILNPLIKGLAISTSVRERLQVLREEILSWESLVSLIRQLELDNEVNGPKAHEQLIRKLRENVQVRLAGSNLVRISYRSRDPEMTQKVVQTINDIFIERNKQATDEEASTAIDFIKNELDIYEQKLEASERGLRDFKELYSIEMPIASSLNKQLVTLEVELTNLLVDNTDAHPAVVENKRKIEALRKQRDLQIRRAAMGAAGREDNYVADPNRYIEIAESIPRQEEELARLTRDYNVNDSIYSHLLQRYEKAHISQRLEESDRQTKFKIIDPPRLPFKPVSPNPFKIIFLAVFLGAIMGTGSVFGAEYLDSSITDVDEARQFLPYPLLGTVPALGGEGDETKGKHAAIGLYFRLLHLVKGKLLK